MAKKEESKQIKEEFDTLNKNAGLTEEESAQVTGGLGFDSPLLPQATSIGESTLGTDAQGKTVYTGE